jgi:periplasmic protein TonB
MFTNLIESQSHRKEFKRRGSFFLFTVAAYAVILFGAGIGSIYAYDAQLEAQASDLELMSWVPPVTPAAPKPIADPVRGIRRPTTSTAPVDPSALRPERTQFVSRLDDPNKIPPQVGTTGTSIPPYTTGAVLSNRNVDPPSVKQTDKGNCLTCSDTPPTVVVPDKAPDPPPVKQPTIAKLPSSVLVSKAISLPQPPYPLMAKQTRIQGNVNIQVLVDEQGKVMAAQVVSGNAMLVTAAREAAMRARFTPTILNGQPVKTQGVIIYNFVLQ